MDTKKPNDLAVRTVSFFISVFLLLLSLYLFVFVSQLVTETRSQKTPIEYTLRLTAVENASAERILVGQSLVDSVGKGRLGSILSVTVTPHREERVQNGVLSLYTDEGKKDLTLRVAADADKDAMRVGSATLRVGRTLYIRLPDYTGSGICISLSEASL